MQYTIYLFLSFVEGMRAVQVVVRSLQWNFIGPLHMQRKTYGGAIATNVSFHEQEEKLSQWNIFSSCNTLKIQNGKS